MSIPVVDLSDFLSNDNNKKTDFILQLGKAYEDVGFVAVKNHGISDKLISELYEYVQNFFALPLEKKLNYEIPGLAGQRGYTSFGREHAKGSEAPDLKEFFQYGQTVENGEVTKSEYPDNVSVSEIFFELYTIATMQTSNKNTGIIIIEPLKPILSTNLFVTNNFTTSVINLITTRKTAKKLASCILVVKACFTYP